MTPHVVLLGDSIFDNARYVPGGPDVIEQLRNALPRDWRATLLAVDGAVASDVARQLRSIPADATHLVVSAGGNDALGHSGVVRFEEAGSYAEVLTRMEEIRGGFQREYRAMLRGVLDRRLPTVVCTIYDAVPILGPPEFAGLCLFNDAILREAFRAAVPVVDLRFVCPEPSDYAAVSPIEPSVAGGRKIASAVARAVTEYDSSVPGTRVVV